MACEGDTWAVTRWGAGGEERRTLQAWERSSVGTPLAALRGGGMGGRRCGEEQRAWEWAQG